MFERYEQAKRDVAALEAWRGDRTSYYPHEVPKHLQHVDNTTRETVELFEWMSEPPARYFAYPQQAQKRIVNWTGQSLGRAIFGRVWRDNFGGSRQSVILHGSNGVTYYGTRYMGHGDYVRLYRTKGS